MSMGTRVMTDFSRNTLSSSREDNDENEIESRAFQKDNVNVSMNMNLDEVADATNRLTEAASNAQGQNEQIQKLGGLSIGFCSIFVEQLLSHPCIVMSRQCQVHHAGMWYHLTPLSVLQSVLNLQRTQGGLVLWKGLGGVYIVRGIGMLSESVLSEVTTFPREVSRHSSLKKYGGHLLLKSAVFALSTPFYAASLVETVQSDIASEKPGLLDVIWEGVARVSSWSVPKTSRQLAVWQLALPTVSFRLAHYVVSSIAQFTVTSAMQLEHQEIRAQPGENNREPSAYEVYFPELLASFTGGMLADIITFPLETVLHRLYVQGTRTIIDNPDTGLGVLPIITGYKGFLDCFRSIVAEEGVPGLYRGFGAMVLQYCVHAAVLRMAMFMFEKLSAEIRRRQDQYALLTGAQGGIRAKVVGRREIEYVRGESSQSKYVVSNIGTFPTSENLRASEPSQSKLPVGRDERTFPTSDEILRRSESSGSKSVIEDERTFPTSSDNLKASGSSESKYIIENDGTFPTSIGILRASESSGSKCVIDNERTLPTSSENLRASGHTESKYVIEDERMFPTSSENLRASVSSESKSVVSISNEKMLPASENVLKDLALKADQSIYENMGNETDKWNEELGRRKVISDHILSQAVNRFASGMALDNLSEGTESRDTNEDASSIHEKLNKVDILAGMSEPINPHRDEGNEQVREDFQTIHDSDAPQSTIRSGPKELQFVKNELIRSVPGSSHALHDADPKFGETFQFRSLSDSECNIKEFKESLPHSSSDDTKSGERESSSNDSDQQSSDSNDSSGSSPYSESDSMFIRGSNEFLIDADKFLKYLNSTLENDEDGQKRVKPKKKKKSKENSSEKK